MNAQAFPGVSAPPAPWPEPALDTGAGLDRLMGDQDMYLRILARFRTDYLDNVARLRTALAAGDMTLAHRIAHTLKGAAAMIEARPLRALAMEVEQPLRGGGRPDPVQLDRLEAELARVMAQVDRLLVAPSADAADAATPPDVAGADKATLADSDIARLCKLLDLGDSSAQDFVRDNGAGLHTRLGAERARELEAAVAAFEFERALRMLEPGATCQAARPTHQASI